MDGRARTRARVARRIELSHAQVGYTLTVVLLEADLDFDAAKVF